MKKLTTITMALALTLLVSGMALAMQGMDHGSMHAGDMSLHESMKVTEDNLALMKQDVERMKDDGQRKDAMDAMNQHMTAMHHGMAGVKADAQKNHNGKMEALLQQLDKEMMTTMKGMGVTKQDPDKGIPMMMDGINKMGKTVEQMKGAM